MIVGGAFVPHSPLLIPSIGREHQKDLEETILALQKLAERIIALAPDTVAIASSHGIIHQDACSANIHDPYQADLREFGDFSTHFVMHPHLALADKLKRHARQSHLLFTQETATPLDYGVSVPMYFLQKLLPHTKILPLSHSLQDFKAHYEFGVAARDVFQNSTERIFVIASGDLSHRLDAHAPGGFAKEGKEFDEALVKMLAAENVSGLLQMSPELVQEAAECALRPLLMVLGMLDKVPFRPEILSYQAPFGIGHCVAQLHMES